MAKLTLLSGLFAGRVVPLDAECLSIGRQVSNDLDLPDLSISRHHCVIETVKNDAAARFVIRDLESANGVRVNGHRVLERELHYGDRIELGDCALLFEDDPSQMLIDDAAEFASTIQLAPAEVQQMHGGAAFDAMPDRERYSGDLSALLDMAVQLSSLSLVPEIQARFLERITARIPAEFAAAIPVISPDLEQCVRRANQYWFPGKDPSGGRPESVVSRTILDRVLRTHQAMVAGASAADPSTLPQTDSIVRAGSRSILAAPAFANDELTGMIYFATPVPGAFDDHHLRLAAAAGTILGVALKRAVNYEEVHRENARLLSQVRIRHQIVGASSGITKVVADIQRVCSTNTTVLIVGETGTGKELVAEAIHANSPRASQCLVALNCAVFTESLIESELFGHERGAFSGAYASKRGVFEQAQGGTLFLDEIGELPVAMQAKLLRVLESREIRRVGGEKAISVDFRLVAATHRNLAEAVKMGAFRSDLYYRMNVVSITIPPLRERRQDIIPLAEYFLAEFRRKTLRHIEGFAPSTCKYLERYDWPGNIRELRNAIERAVIAGASPLVTIEDLPDSLSSAPVVAGEPIPYKQALLEARRKIVLEAFRAAGGTHSQAAELLGIHPNNLHRMLNELGLREQVRRTHA
jgi:transcriptional regulator with GAF, ATPase, and Fis domain